MLKNINKRVSLGKKTEKESEVEYVDNSKNYCEISHTNTSVSQSPLDNPMMRRYFDELMTQKQYHTGEILKINTEIYAKFGIRPT